MGNNRRRYIALFPSDTGLPAKPLRMALESLMLQKQYGYSDRELLEQIRENLYYQYFAGLPGFQNEPPLVLLLLVEFRKRLNDEFNEIIITYNTSDDPGPGTGGGNGFDVETEEPANSGTIILDTTCPAKHPLSTGHQSLKRDQGKPGKDDRRDLP